MNLEKEIFELAISDIMPNRFQPREVFDDESINELAQSIKEHGVIQPIIVRKIGDKYEIVAGERRFRASQVAGKATIPALIRNIDDKESAKIALLENLQRKNLTAIEEAKTYQTILKLDNLTQEELAQNLGKSQSAIANKLRLLNLDQDVQQALLNGQISERHARSLLNIDDKEKQKEELNKIIMNRMTVKQLDDEISLITGKTFNNEEEEVSSNHDNSSFNEISIPTANAEKDFNDLRVNPLENTNVMNNSNINNIPESVVNEPKTVNEPETSNIINTNSFMESYNNMNETSDLTDLISMNEEKTEELPVKNTPTIELNPNLESQPVIAPVEPTKPVVEELPNNSFNMETPSAQQPVIESIAPTIVPVEPASTTGIDMFANIDNLINKTATEQVTPINNINMETSSARPTMPEVVQPELPNITSPIINNMETPVMTESVINTPIATPLISSNNFSVEEPTIGEKVVEPTIPNFPLPNNDSIVATNPNNVYDLRFAINNFRQAVQNTEKFGFNIDVEEFDFDNVYQIVIKIDKDKQ